MITPVFSGDDVLALFFAPATAFFHARFSCAQAEGKFAHPEQEDRSNETDVNPNGKS